MQNNIFKLLTRETNKDLFLATIKVFTLQQRRDVWESHAA